MKLLIFSIIFSVGLSLLSCIEDVDPIDIAFSGDVKFVLQDSKNRTSTNYDVIDTVGHSIRIGISNSSLLPTDSIQITVFNFRNTMDSVFVIKNVSTTNDTIWHAITFLTPGKRNYEVIAYIKESNPIIVSGSMTIYAKAIFATIEPSKLLRPINSKAVFNVLTEGDSPFTYAWFHDSVQIIGQTTKSLTLNNLQFADSGNYKSVVHDKWGNTATTNTAKLTIKDSITNIKPSLSISGYTTILALESCSLWVSALDPDSDQRISYSVIKAPQGYNFLNNLFLWTPASSYLGTDSIKTDTVIFVATDDGVPVASDTQIVEITVQKMMQVPGKVIGLRGVSRSNGKFVFSWNKSRFASAYEIHRSHDSTQFEKYLIINDTTFTDKIQDTVFYYQVFAINSNGSSHASKTIASSSVNTSPAWSHSSFQLDVQENQSLSVNFADSVTDVNGDQIFLSLVDGLPYTDSLVGSKWSYKPGYSDSGNYSIKIEATDRIATPVVLMMNVRVINVNRPPEFLVNRPNNAYGIVETQQLTFSVRTIDPDSDRVIATIKSTTLPRPNTISFSEGTLSWASTAGDSGIYEIEFEVSDGSVVIPKTVVIFINKILPIPQAPLLLVPANHLAQSSVNPEVSWNSSLFATNYHLQISNSSSFDSIIFQDSNIALTNQKLSNTTSGKQYFWRVRAKNFIGTSSWSEVWNFKTVAQYSLSLTNPVNGTINISPIHTVYDSNSVISLSAIPAEGYQFTGWSGDFTGNENPALLTMNSPKSITANFVKISFSLAINSLANGNTVTRSPSQNGYDSGTVVTLTPVAAQGFRFTGWGGDLSGTDSIGSIAMNSSKIITANFTRVFQLQVSTSNGSVSKSPNNSSNFYDSGVVINLTAIPMTGYRFGNWGGSLSGSINPQSITMNSAKSVTANFIKVMFSLNITATNGTVSRNPNNANSVYDSGSLVTLTPIPSAGYRFAGWSGDLTGTTNPVTIAINSTKNISPIFVKNQFVVNTRTRADFGIVSGIITCEPSRTTYDSGAVLDLIAPTDVKYQFVNWTDSSGRVLASGKSLSVVVNKNLTLYANYLVKTCALEMITSPTQGGTITSTPTGSVNCGTTVTVVAIPSPGYKFLSWTGASTSLTPTVLISMDYNRSITALFEPLVSEVIDDPQLIKN